MQALDFKFLCLLVISTYIYRTESKLKYSHSNGISSFSRCCCGNRSKIIIKISYSMSSIVTILELLKLNYKMVVVKMTVHLILP